MTVRIVFRRAASAEFEEAAIWYESQRHGLGDEFSSEVGLAIEKVAENPALYPVVFGDIRRTATRRFPFAIYFRVRESVVVVLAVFHGRRDPSVWKRRA
jgi:plasmid stabilization system protein ParE